MVASRVLCKHTVHLRKLTEAVIDEGGEGVILRQVRSLYIPGRSPFLIKLKVLSIASLFCSIIKLIHYMQTTYADAEAIVSAKGLDGSVTLRLYVHASHPHIFHELMNCI